MYLFNSAAKLNFLVEIAKKNNKKIRIKLKKRIVFLLWAHHMGKDLSVALVDVDGDADDDEGGDCYDV